MTENQGYSYNSQNPSGIWQGIWAQCFTQTLYAMSEGNYAVAYNRLLDLQSMLPPECNAETKAAYEKAEKIICREVAGYSTTQREFYAKQYTKQYAPPAIRELMATVISSLFNKGWINKNFGAKPLKANIPHIKSDA